MYINATLLVQIVNFFIAYVILRVLFFKPALQELDAEKREKQGLEENIDGIKQVLEVKKRIRETQWQEVQKFYVERRPSLDDQGLFYFRGITPELSSPHIQEGKVEDLIAVSSDELASKIRKIYDI